MLSNKLFKTKTKNNCPKNHPCLKFHHKSSLYPKGETTEQVQATSDDSRNHRWSVINIFQKKHFYNKNPSCLKLHQKGRLHPDGLTTEAIFVI